LSASWHSSYIGSRSNVCSSTCNGSGRWQQQQQQQWLPGASEANQQHCNACSLDPIAEDPSNSISSAYKQSRRQAALLQQQPQQQQQQQQLVLDNFTSSWDSAPSCLSSGYGQAYSDHHAAAGYCYPFGSTYPEHQDPFTTPEPTCNSTDALLLVEQEIAQLLAMRQRLVNAAAAAPPGSQLAAACQAALAMHTQTLLVALETREACQQEEALAAAEEALLWQQHVAQLQQQQRQAAMAWYYHQECCTAAAACETTAAQEQQQHSTLTGSRQGQAAGPGSRQCRPSADMPPETAVAAGSVEQVADCQVQLMQLLSMVSGA
jgi:hypothetical protein